MVLYMKSTLIQKQVENRWFQHDLWICSSEYSRAEC